MKLLRRALLIKWHYIEHELIEFAPVTFLTGKNAAGKSTILDALQLVLLGDTTGHYFNKAANGGSKRTLKGYLRGEVAEEDQNGVINLRDGQFSSYIVLEFSEEQGRKPFCMGVVFDTPPDGLYEWRFFSLQERIPDFHFIRDGIPLGIRELRAWGLTRKNRFEMFESNKRYQEVFRARMGNLKEKFFQLFRKAVPFSPIMDIAGFISEFVCDVDVHLDIEDMRENIRYYRRMEGDLKAVENRMEALREMNAAYEGMEATRKKAELYEYLLDQAALTERELRTANLQTTYQECEAKTAKIDGEIESLASARNVIGDKRDSLISERANSGEYQRRGQLEQQKKLLESEFSHIKRDGERQDRFLIDHRGRWYGVEKQLEETDAWWQADLVGLGEEKSSVGSPSPEVKLWQTAPLYNDAIRAIQEGLSCWPKKGNWQACRLLDKDMPFAAVPDEIRVSTAHLQQSSRLLREAEHVMQGTVRAWTQESKELARAVSELERGIKQYDAKVLKLKELLEKELSLSGKMRKVQIFAELLDIENPEWQKAIEGYLYTQRFYLIVPPEDFGKALRLYNKVKGQYGLFDVGLVDVAKVMAEKPEAQKGSLAEEILTDNPYARAYADYLLGRVMKCEHVDELRNHRTSITRDGMLYQNYVARQINPARFSTLYIGKRAIAEMLMQKQARQLNVKQLIDDFVPRLAMLSEWSNQPVPAAAELSLAEDFLQTVEELPKLCEDYRVVIMEMGQINLSRIEEIEREIEACTKTLAEQDDRIRELDGERGSLHEQKRRLREIEIPALKSEAEDKKREIDSKYNPQNVAEMHPRFEQELKRLGTPDKVSYSFGRMLVTEKNHIAEAWNLLVRIRETYNRNFGTGFDIQRHDNLVYQAEHARLEESRLTEYADKIKEARERAQIQFQEDFINKLRSNIETVEQQITELNYALREVSFGGRERYQFKVSPNQQYEPFYRMIMDELLLEGRSLFSQAFMDKHGEVIEELFRHIVDVDEQDLAVQIELERNLHKFTDYRTYVDFDLIVKDEEGRESRLSRMIAKRSGGETQTPFYIAVLASFAQTYHVNQPGLSNTLRLLMFDEAYSKMDHQRIRDSIKLVRDMHLQVILSAPTEKIADIVPLVDKTLVVQRIKSETRIAPFEPEPMGVR